MDRMQFRLNRKAYDIGVERRPDGYIYFSIPFPLKDIIVPEMKDSFEDMEWMGFKTGEKFWRVPETQLNCFRLQLYFGLGNPYAWYDRAVHLLDPTPGAYEHQTRMTSIMVQFRQCIMGAEMGTGKTRAAFDALKYILEHTKDKSRLLAETVGGNIWWVAPRSALYSIILEQAKWEFPIPIRLMTPEGLTKIIHNWPKGQLPPFAVILDEAQKYKSELAKRTKAATHLADNIRETYGRDGIVWLLTGSPAPKSPVDLWSLARIACPGFLREGSSRAFKRRLCLTVEATNNITGTVYPKLVTWWDDPAKCGVCGMAPTDQYHNMAYYMPNGPYHSYKQSTNEVQLVAERLKGLMTTVLKRDVLKSLPEKIYRRIQCPVSQSTIRGAKMITNMNPKGSLCLTLLREYSDGFQYADEVIGSETCPVCVGTCTMHDSMYIGPELDDFDLPDPSLHPEHFKQIILPCGMCDGTGEIPKTKQVAEEIPTPKEQVLTDLLDEFEDASRAVIWAGFHGSIDRVRRVVDREKWDWIKADGRGWECSWRSDSNRNLKPQDMLREFQSDSTRKIAYIGHPGAGGTGVTLTRSPVAIYYSNDFNYENRIQSEDRIHRLGMDVNRGATVIDILHLPSDLYVLDNLMRKQKLQAISIGDLHTILSTPTPPDRGYGVHAHNVAVTS